MSAPSMIDVVTVTMKNRGHEGVDAETIERIASTADGLETAAAIDALEDAMVVYEKTHPVHPDFLRRRRAERIAALERKQAEERRARKARR